MQIAKYNEKYETPLRKYVREIIILQIYSFIVGISNLCSIIFILEAETFTVKKYLYFSLQFYWFQYQICIMSILSQTYDKLKRYNQELIEIIKKIDNDEKQMRNLLKDTTKFLMFINDMVKDFCTCFTFTSLILNSVQGRAEVAAAYAMFLCVRNPTIENFSFFFFMINCCLINWHYAFYLIKLSSSLKREAKATLNILQKGIKSCVMSKRNSKLLEILNLQNSHCLPIISLGFFKLDWYFAFIYVCDQLALVIVMIQFYEEYL